VIHADIDATDSTRSSPPTSRFTATCATRWRRWWRNSCARRFRALTPGRARRRNSAVRSRADRVAEHVLSATDVLDRFFAAVPPEAIVTVDVGQHQMWAAPARPPDPPAALPEFFGTRRNGIRFPRRDRRAVRKSRRSGVRRRRRRRFSDVPTGTGDAAALRRPGQSAADRQPKSRHGPAVARTVLLGSLLGDQFGRTIPTLPRSARAYGIEAFAVADPSAADATIAAFIAHAGPALLHAACHPTENVWPMIPAGMTVDDLMEARA